MATRDQLTIDEIISARDADVAANLAAATAPHRVAYHQHVTRILGDLARSRTEFSAEDVRERIPNGIEPHSPNVLPSLIRSWSRRGVIMPVGWVTATRPTRHGSVIRLWRGTGCADN